MKKLVLGLAVSGVLGLTGCGGDGPADPLIPDGTNGVGQTALTKATYSPSTGSIPLPNDLLFSGSTDLTLNIPVPPEEANNYANPKVTLSGLDGWSGIAPFAIGFSNEHGVDIDQQTIIPGSTIKLFEVNVNRPEAIPGTGVPVPTGPVTSVVRELTAGQEFVATYAGTKTAAVIPLVPLTPQASYMVVVTNGVKDAKGNSVVADVQYQFAKSADPLSGSLAALEPVRQLVNAMESAADAAGVAKDSIVLSFQFTVQSMGSVIEANRAFYIDYPILLGQVPYTSFSSLYTDMSPFTGMQSTVNLYKGEFGLTYFLGAAQSPYDPAPTNTFFTGAAQIPNPAFDAGQPPSENNPPLMANPFAGGFTTYANPLVAPKGAEIVPLLVAMPKPELCPKPEGGYPVTIFQHGITSNRTSMLGIADAFGSICNAVVAMDLPLHGIAEDNAIHQGLQAASGGMLGIFEGYTPGSLRERTFGLDLYHKEDNVIGRPDGIPDTSGFYTMNLANLLVGRDNNRQAALDLLALEKALMFMDVDGDASPDFDTSKLSFMGHSWGGIVGNIYLAHSRVLSVPGQEPDNSSMVKTVVLANTGGSLMGMIDGSEQFGDPVKAALAAKGIEEGSADYKSFLFVGQTVIDDGDAINSYLNVAAKQIPTLALQVAGDTAVPNAVATSPTAGTEYMAQVLGLQTVSATNPGETVVGSRLFSKLNQGVHPTVVYPYDYDGNYIGNVTREMQTHTVSFIASGGNAITVVDPSLLAE